MRAITRFIVAGFTAVVLAHAPPAIAATPDRETPIEAGCLTTPDGQQLYYQKVGAAPRIVIQPGRLFAFEDFKWLGGHFTLISCDMRNRGRSGAERISLLGYSYLGKIDPVRARASGPRRSDRPVRAGAA